MTLRRQVERDPPCVHVTLREGWQHLLHWGESGGHVYGRVVVDALSVHNILVKVAGKTGLMRKVCVKCVASDPLSGHDGQHVSILLDDANKSVYRAVPR